MADNRPMIHVEFVNRAVEDKVASKKEGRPIFKDVPHCKIKWVGDKTRELEEPAHQKMQFDRETHRYITYAERFPEHWRLFEAGQAQAVVNGTPISELPFLTEAKRAELRALNIMTAESLAGLEGTLLQRLGMGGRDLKNQAQAWLDKASSAADDNKLRAELDQLRAEIATLRAGGTGTAPVSPFEQWQDDDIKNWIKDQTGKAPAGNPSHKTLVARADEVNAELAKEAA